AGFMEQGAALAIDNDVLTITPRNDIYVRYLSDNRGMLAELASEFFGRPIKVDLSAIGTGAPPEPLEPQADSSKSREADTRTSEDQPHAAVPNPKPAPGPTSSEERASVYSDPGIRRIFDAFEARLVEIRAAPNPTKTSGGESGQ